MSKYTKAKFLQKIGEKIPAFCRMSTVFYSRGSSDLLRDMRGFAWKFYTEDGNYDMVGINLPVFFVRDPIKMPDLAHSYKPHPKMNATDPNTSWDYNSLNPETMHGLLMMYSDRGVPAGYRFMNGYGVHTFKWVNDKGEASFVKYHFISD